jgi:hypothetical protein
MSKKTTEQVVSGAPADTKQPAYVEELLKNGTTILTAKTRDELAEMVNDIPADCSYMAGAVGFNPETGVFSLRLDITNH